MSMENTRSAQDRDRFHPRQVKISVAPELADAFKKSCSAANVSMASTLSRFMSDYSNAANPKQKPAPDYSTRRKRRAAIKKIIRQIEEIRDNEERHHDNIPDNLQGSSVFDNAVEFISYLEEAISALESIDEV